MDKIDSIVISAFSGWIIFWLLFSYSFDPTGKGFSYNAESAISLLIGPGIIYLVYKLWKRSKAKEISALR